MATLPDLPACQPPTTPAPGCSPNAVDQEPIPNFASWGPGGALYVTDYAQAVIWRIPRDGGKPRAWFKSAQLDGSEFGTTGIVWRPGSRDFLVAQQSTAADTSLPTNGKLYRLPVTETGKPRQLSTLWTSQPTELPDGFGVARSGRIYMSLAGPSAQLVVISAARRGAGALPRRPGWGERVGDPLRHPLQRHLPRASGCWSPTSPTSATPSTTRSSTSTSTSAAWRRTCRGGRCCADRSAIGNVPGMAIKLENVAIAVRDLEATIAFFTDLGLSVLGRDEVSGEWTDTAVGLDGNHAKIAMLQTPDGHGRLELFEYIHPDAIETEPTLPNEIGMHRVAFSVDDLDEALEIAARHGCHPLRGVGTYEDIYKLTYVRGPSGIIVMLAEALQKG